jgi:capsular exopolysaccharide synthesis family protein
MTFVALLTAVRRRWVWLVAGLLVGLLTAAVVTALVPRSYSSTTSLYVSAVDDTSAQNAYQGVLLSQQRVKSYTEILTSDRVLAPVIDQLRLGETTTALAKHVTVTADTDSTLLRVAVTDSSPQRAAATADAISARFVGVVGQLERPTGTGAPAVVVSSVDAAVANPTPVSPRWSVNLVVGAVLGLVLGAVAAVVRAATDRTLRSPRELAALVETASLGSLPAVPGGLEDPAGEGPYAEAVRRVRTNVLFADVDTPPAVLTVTSALPGEGKTTLVCALAAAFAVNGRVAVVEADLRAPGIAERLGLVGEVGLTDVLTRRVDLADALQSWRGIDVLTSGVVPHDPSGLLSSQALVDVVTTLRATHDVVLFDAPPLGPVADAAVLASRSEGALLLCRAESTSTDAVVAAAESLRAVGGRLVGSVLTMTRGSAADGYGRYGTYGTYGAASAPAPAPDAAGPAPAAPAPARPAALTTSDADEEWSTWFDAPVSAGDRG